MEVHIPPGSYKFQVRDTQIAVTVEAEDKNVNIKLK